MTELGAGGGGWGGAQKAQGLQLISVSAIGTKIAMLIDQSNVK